MAMGMWYFKIYTVVSFVFSYHYVSPKIAFLSAPILGLIICHWRYESLACIDACRHQPPTVPPWWPSMQKNMLCQYCIYKASGENFSAFLLQLRKGAQAFKLWILGHMGCTPEFCGCSPNGNSSNGLAKAADMIDMPRQKFWGMHLRIFVHQCSRTATNKATWHRDSWSNIVLSHSELSTSTVNVALPLQSENGSPIGTRACWRTWRKHEGKLEKTSSVAEKDTVVWLEGHT